jgi:uncharacterized protein
MKVQVNFSVKVLTALLLINVSMLTSCGTKKRGASTPEIKTSGVEKKVNVPQITIHAAAFLGELNAIKQHIAAGTDLNQKDEYGSTPLAIAATFGKTAAAKVLIKGGADINLKNNDGSTPLSIAAFFCRPDIVKILLESGADKSLKNNYGSTALESVSGPFNEVEAIYRQLNKDLGPLGLRLDFDYLKKTRPVIAEMLR